MSSSYLLTFEPLKLDYGQLDPWQLDNSNCLWQKLDYRQLDPWQLDIDSAYGNSWTIDSLTPGSWTLTVLMATVRLLTA